MTRSTFGEMAAGLFQAAYWLLFPLIVVVGLLALSLPALGETVPATPDHMFEHGWKQWWLPPNHSRHGVPMDTLFSWTFWITAVVFVVVEIVLVIFMIQYRGRKDKVKGVYSHGNTRLEMAWTIIPAVILAVLSVYGKRVWDDYRYGEESRAKDAVNILVVGQQFKWNYVYAGPDNKIGKYFAFPHTTDPKFRKYNQSEVMKRVNTDIGENPLGQFQASDEVQAETTKYDADLSALKAKLSAPALAAMVARENTLSPSKVSVSDPVKAELTMFDIEIDHLNSSLSKDARIWLDTRDDDYATQPGRPLILPVETPLNLQLTAKDVIHDFFMPNMRVKLDAVPGTRGIINFTADRGSLSTQVKKLNDPTINDLVEGDAPLIWIDAHTPGAAKMPDNSYALVDPKDKATPIVSNLAPTAITVELKSKLEAVGIHEVTQVTKKWSVVCEQLCGAQHTTMRGEVIFVTPEQYWDFIHKPDAATTRPATITAAPAPSNTPLAEASSPRK